MSNQKELFDTLSNEDCKLLGILGCKLSPENLSCDGELSHAATDKRLKELMCQWYAIEKRVGFSIDEYEYESYHYRYRDNRTGAIK